MIIGLGLDLCDPQRVARVLERRGEAFMRKVLGTAEQAEFHRRQQQHTQRAVHYLASRFAAKEALGKALGVGMAGLVRWHDCECLNGELGQPQWFCHGELGVHLRAQGWQVSVSLSDEHHVVAAVVIVSPGIPPPGRDMATT